MTWRTFTPSPRYVPVASPLLPGLTASRYFLKHICKTRVKMLEKVSLADALLRSPPDLFPQPVVGQQALEELSQLIYVATGHQVPGYPVLDDVQRAAVGPTDNGLAERHSLQKHQPKSFLTAGHGEDVAAA